MELQKGVTNQRGDLWSLQMTFAPSRILVARDAPLELLVPSPVRTPLATEEDFLFPLRDDGPWHAVGEPESDPLGDAGCVKVREVAPQVG